MKTLEKIARTGAEAVKTGLVIAAISIPTYFAIKANYEETKAMPEETLSQKQERQIKQKTYEIRSNHFRKGYGYPLFI